MQKWVVINKKADFKSIGERFGIDQVTARIIRNRDIMEEEEIETFLHGTRKDLHDPKLMKDAEILVDCLVDKIRHQKAIRIIGDYDIDGVMSTFILKKALLRCGANVSAVIPDRKKDGYGLNVTLIQNAYEDGVDTILTCDNGIAAMKEIAEAKKLGMSVLVTDHHEIPYDEDENGNRTYLRSEADAIVNPHQLECSYPYKALCGAAVAWKMVCLLYQKLGISQEEADEFLENVAFATVGDIMDLTGENRILVKEGLKRIHHTRNIGMQALIQQCNLSSEQIDCYHFGFVLGPCINASGRLETASKALELLLCEDKEVAVERANELVILNEERKSLTLEGTELAKQICKEKGYENDSVLVIYLPEVHESIAGIIAGRIREVYHKPTFILTRAEEGVKGSGRSIEEYSMYEEMCKCKELFTKFGGHPMAAGLSLPESNVDEFRRRINGYSRLTEEDFCEKIRIDVPMPLDYVTMELTREFHLLAPFGKANPHPVFADKELSMEHAWIIGKNRNVLKLALLTSYGTKVSAIYFGDIEEFQTYICDKWGEEQWNYALSGTENNIRLSIIYFPKINTYRDVDSLQIEIKSYQ